ncbi:MAG: bifunctional lysylphosphatidylglycerol flippase/synthetase MprF [Bacteroidales bacterium]|nr:bifunctional lysylphosphatidylglycerol flippase/synthetase MprF [Bacteroidales bacterium]
MFLVLKKFPQVMKEKSIPFLRENGNLIGQFILTLFFIALGIWFLKHERAELFEVKTVLVSSRWLLILLGITITVLYLLLQGLMYVTSFASVHSKVSLLSATILFLKRNFISIFLPAGGVSSLAFFTGEIEKKGITKTQIHFASSVYGFVGILSVVVVAIPAFSYALFAGSIGSSEWFALIAVILLITIAFLIYRLVISKGAIYRWIVKISPSLEVFIEDLRNKKIDRKQFYFTILVSIIIDIVGILHLYVAMMALQLSPSFFAALMAYLIAVIFLIISPFLRGLGAIEVSMSYVLVKFGYTNVEAIAVTFLYRFFEFWLPLIAGILSFLIKINKLLMRIIPALLIFLLSIINIISVLTPAVAERLNTIQNIVPIDAITASNYFVMIAGLFMLVTSAFLLKGLRTAWWFAVLLSTVSIVGHLIKAIDYEEAIVAFIVLLVLIRTRKDYYVKNNPKLRYIGVQTALLSFLAVLLYGIIGFYFLDKKHFNIDFSWWQSIQYTLQYYFLVGSTDLSPIGSFAKYFLLSINVSGFASLSFLIYTLIRPFVIKDSASEHEMLRAKELISKNGNSGVDYFKTYFDKLFFFSSDEEAFISYRVSGNYAVVLENPVGTSNESIKKCIKSFDSYCYENGLKSIFYRVPEENLEIYKELGKKSLFLGQEGIVDLQSFTLEGGSRKSLRNAVNKVIERGYKAKIYNAPVKDGELQKIKSVSDEWLALTERKEIIFSQGMFLWDELKQQTIITVESPEEKVVAFLNLIPDYAKDEATYDLMRKTADAPNGILDFIMIEMFNHLKSKNFRYVNLGFAPMSGLNDPHTFTEKSMKFAYEKIRSFSHYKGMRDFKEKYSPIWYNKYLIYENDYDLIQVPRVLSAIIKP